MIPGPMQLEADYMIPSRHYGLQRRAAPGIHRTSIYLGMLEGNSGVRSEYTPPGIGRLTKMPKELPHSIFLNYTMNSMHLVLA